jgi:4-hydroxybenzoate polyprenyltransferase
MGRLTFVTTIRSVVALAGAAHPQPTLAVTAGAAALAVATGRDWPGIAAVALTVLASQLAVGWHNDWLDAGRDRAARRSDKPIARGQVSAHRVAMAAVVAAAATIPLGLLSGWRAALVGTIGLGSALAYNWPLKFTPLSPLPYVVSFGALPAFVILGRPDGAGVPWWLVGAGATLGAGAHFANVLPDLDDDLRQGVRGLPPRLGRPASTAIAAALVMAVSLLLAFGPAGPARPVGIAGLAAAALTLAIGGFLQWHRPRSRAAFRAVLVVAMIDVCLLVTAGALIQPAGHSLEAAQTFSSAERRCDSAAAADEAR